MLTNLASGLNGTIKKKNGAVILTRVSVGHGNLPYTEVSRHGREIFTKRQGKNVPAVISGRDFRFRDAPSAQQRRKKQHDGEDVEKRNGDRIRESVQDDFIDNVAAGADRVPACTQQRDPHRLLHRRTLHRRHLPARVSALLLRLRRASYVELQLPNVGGGRARERERALPSTRPSLGCVKTLT